MIDARPLLVTACLLAAVAGCAHKDAGAEVACGVVSEILQDPTRPSTLAIARMDRLPDADIGVLSIREAARRFRVVGDVYYADVQAQNEGAPATPGVEANLFGATGDLSSACDDAGY